MKPHLPVILSGHRFSARDTVGGDAALDFVNTVSGRDQSPRDRLDCYARLLEWAALAHLVPQRTLRALARRAEREPAAAAAALARAKALREVLFALIVELASGRAPKKGALALVHEYWIRGAAAHALRFRDGRVEAELRTDAADFDLVASMVAYRMVQHVLPLPRDRLRICQGQDCSWVFIDTSKAGRRRWCDMAVCGNAAKARRFYARSRERRGSGDRARG
jgi:predicted RNA-binding Zn ribbon-like protein